MFYSLWGPLHAIAFNIVVFALLFAHGRAVLSDPGTVPLPKIGLDFSDMLIQKKSSKAQVLLLYYCVVPPLVSCSKSNNFVFIVSCKFEPNKRCYLNLFLILRIF